MSGIEKFVVNRFNEREGRSLFGLISGAVGLPENSSVLELGAGRGALSLQMYDYYKPARCVVTDYDPLQLEEAKSYFGMKLGAIPKGVEFRVADALDLPFEDGSFNAVFASHVLHHVELHEWHFKRIPQALDEIARVLKLDGIFAFEEMFKKREIVSHLRLIGFMELFAKESWLVNKFFVYQKTLDIEGNKVPS